MTAIDPKQLLDQSPMNRFQVLAVCVCIMLTALDGFDILAISFAAPGIAQEWSISRAGLGVVLAMELFGMAVGSIALGGIADRFGRRPTILFCLVLMTAGMYLASLVHTVDQLLAVRFCTGLGIGGMLASTNAMVAEFSNAKHRSLAVIFMAAGYPIGAVLGGSVATVLLQQMDWRAIFVFGAIATGLFLIIVWFCLPESIEYLGNRRPQNALDRINRTLKKMGHEPIVSLPEANTSVARSSYWQLFSDRYRAVTGLLMVGYFTHFMTFYYVLKWMPKVVVDMGYEASSAGGVLVWANVGGVLGALCLGLLTSRVKLRKLLVAVLLLSFFMVCGFGVGQSTLPALSVMAAATGFFTNAGVVGYYALVANAFPSALRASGTGVVIGVGRGGAALGPVLAGVLFSSGFDLLFVSIVMGAGAVVAAAAVILLRPVLKQQDVTALS
ncbi:MAG: MFS transporter [Halioglobus sp.]